MIVRTSAAACLLPALFALAGCGGDDPRVVKVVAATSLKRAVEAAAEQYESDHPDLSVRASFAPSDQIQRQIEGGLEVDVIAMASGDQMAPLARAGLAEDAAPFTGNKLAIAVGVRSKVSVTAAKDLSGPMKLSLGQPEVPIGKYANESIASMSGRYGDAWRRAVGSNVVNRALNAADVITPVALGGADASISYVTDLKANAGRVNEVAIPDWAQPTIAYWIAQSPGASDAGEDFIAYVKSDAGQSVLQAKGFLAVPAGAGATL